jgi:hypothetical protein
MAAKRILLLEDDAHLAGTLLFVLQGAGDGTAVADRAADLGAKTAVLTGYVLQMPREKAERHEVWMKPMRPSELVAAVERCIGKPGLRIGKPGLPPAN